VILLARHGETDHNAAPQRVQGWIDIPLNDRGRAQARELADAVRGEPLAALYSSQLVRARETADIVAAELGLAVVVDERLAESNRGAWEGRLIAEIEQEEPERWAAWRRGGASFRFPGGESLQEHADRVGAALDDVRRGLLPALVVCHGGTIRCARALSDPRGLDAFHELEVPNAVPIALEA
jgi:broad specificity phosphatase PhoE